MKVVLLCRDGLMARYLAHELAREAPLAAIVAETGREARRRKWRRSWGRTPWWRAPLLFLDLLALAVYGRLWKRALRRRLGGHPALGSYPAGVERHVVVDAGSDACVALLERLAPDVLVVLGTSILGPRVLAIPTRAALNVHGGVVPEYRNVHSEVWAVLNGEPQRIGTSVIHLDEGIDSGDVALQACIDVSASDGFFDLRWRNVELAARLAREALRRLEEGTLPRRPQSGADAGFYPTPGAAELIRLARARPPSSGD